MITYCGTNPTLCGSICSRGITEQTDIDTIVNKHNELRSYVAQGKETQGVTPQPKATDMYSVKWNSTLAEVAQRWADQCNVQQAHDKNRRTQHYFKTDVGQNMAWQGNSVFPTSRNYTGLIQLWYDEVKIYNPYTDNKGKEVGHYTQVIWGDTVEIGCGFVLFSAQGSYQQFLICNYGPAGNDEGELPYTYTNGTVGSACPNGVTNGLCDNKS